MCGFVSVQVREKGLVVVASGQRLLLQKVLEEKNAEMMKALMRSGAPYTSSALSSLLGGGNKDETGWN